MRKGKRFFKAFVYKVGRAENDLFQIIQDGHLLEDPGKSQKKIHGNG